MDVDEFASGKLWIPVDLAATAEETAEVAEAEVVDVDELAQHVEVLYDLSRLYSLESPHVLRPHSRVLVPTRTQAEIFALKMLMNCMPSLSFHSNIEITSYSIHRMSKAIDDSSLCPGCAIQQCQVDNVTSQTASLYLHF